MERVKKFIEDNQIKDSGLKLLTAANSLYLLKIIEEEALRLGGFDGFYIWPDGVQIEQDLSRDYSNQTKQRVLESATLFFQERLNLKDVGYELVIIK